MSQGVEQFHYCNNLPLSPQSAAKRHDSTTATTLLIICAYERASSRTSVDPGRSHPQSLSDQSTLNVHWEPVILNRSGLCRFRVLTSGVSKCRGSRPTSPASNPLSHPPSQLTTILSHSPEAHQVLPSREDYRSGVSLSLENYDRRQSLLKPNLTYTISLQAYHYWGLGLLGTFQLFTATPST